LMPNFKFTEYFLNIFYPQLSVILIMKKLGRKSSKELTFLVAVWEFVNESVGIPAK